MTKKHHPHSRAERMAQKLELDAKKDKHAGKVRRRIIESLKEQETEDELREVERAIAHS